MLKTCKCGSTPLANTSPTSTGTKDYNQKSPAFFCVFSLKRIMEILSLREVVDVMRSRSLMVIWSSNLAPKLRILVGLAIQSIGAIAETCSAWEVAMVLSEFLMLSRKYDFTHK
jgi:hypothetical protein